jgi:hypothetical protein
MTLSGVTGYPPRVKGFTVGVNRCLFQGEWTGDRRATHVSAVYKRNYGTPCQLPRAASVCIVHFAVRALRTVYASKGMIVGISSAVHISQ